MRLSITRRELVEFLSRPAQRAIRDMGSSLGNRLPELEAREEEVEEKVPLAEASGHLEVSPLEPNVPPRAASVPVTLSLRSHVRARTAAQRQHIPGGDTREELRSRGPGSLAPTHLEPAYDGLAQEGLSREQNGSHSGPATLRAERPPALPPSVNEEEKRTAPAMSQAWRPVIALRPRGVASTTVTREHAPSGDVGAELPPEARTVHATPPLPAEDAVSAPPPELAEAPLRRTRRLFPSSAVAARPTFAPAVSPSVAVMPGSVPVTALAKQVVSGMESAWNEAHRLSHEALTVKPQFLTQERTSPPTSAAVKNTFNVSVHLEPNGLGTPMDRTTLEDALVDVLRDAARRHGLEV